MDEIPLTELHRHLDGSLRATTVKALAAEMGIHVPDDIYFYPGMGLDEALSKFSFTLALLQTATSLARVASEICSDAREEGSNISKFVRAAASRSEKGCRSPTL